MRTLFQAGFGAEDERPRGQVRLSIVVPSWNGRQLLQQHLPSLLTAAEEVGDAEVLVVDDGSTDNTAEFLQRYFPDVKVVLRPVNGGFSAAANEGVARASGEFIFLVNNDVHVPKGTILPLLGGLADPSVFATVPRIVRTDNGVDESLTALTFYHGIVYSVVGKPLAKEPAWACGAACCFRRSVFLEIGGFNEIFAPCYWEDVDLSYRAKKRGWRVARCEHVEVLHEHSRTIGTTLDGASVQFVADRNRLFFIWKNITDRCLFLQHVAFLTYYLAVKKNHWVRKVLRDALRKVKVIRKARQRERAEAVVADRKLLCLGVPP